MDMDPDVREVIDEFVTAAPERGIRVELSGFEKLASAGGPGANKGKRTNVQ
jgi:hypothetical protein